MAQRTSVKANDNPSQSIGYLMKVLSQFNMRRMQVLLDPYDLTPFHWFVLRTLWAENGLPVTEITARLQEVGGTMTGVIDRMEDRGLVSRVRDPADRRISRVFLTKKGQDLERELKPIVDRSRKQLTKGIAPRDLATFQRVAEQLLDNCKTILDV